ncbi:HK97 gp10 family phage protein [uncultured Selenomonas sp.]|uniref:HK97 gp10 family phage protein n=1 Tax=uncultured Selenomonas sp. TaxID=159275 RepID=UPI0028EF9794|nr:HK97 gp10 family phage protein [uncultured Selenomonas sp.]
MGVEISGLDDFEKMLADAEKRQHGVVNTFLKVEAEELLGAARDKTPVDTGALRLNWVRGQPQGGTVEVGNAADYAAHVEYGHRIVRMVGGKKEYTGKVKKGVHMLKTSVNERRENFRENAQEILKEMFK